MFGTVNASTVQALSPSNEQQDAAYVGDSKVKKYDTQLAKLRAEILKLQEKVLSISKLRQERISEISPEVSTKEVKKGGTTKKLAEFPLSGTTWRTRFFPTGTPPLNAFKAFYFNTKAPTKLIASAQVASVDIEYAWEKGPGFTIVSEDFGGYWIGDFTLLKDEEMVIDVSQSWSETRMIIDGYLVYKGGSNASINVRLPKGRHTLEVEYVNNWHTVGFSASIRTLTEVPKNITANEIKGIDHNEVWYVGVYESGAADKTIRLVPKKSNTVSKILFLSSYDAVKWDASLLKNAGVTAIIYNSYDPGAQVLNVPQGVTVHKSNIPYGYTLKASCATNDRFGLMACEGIDEFTKVYSAITGLTTKPLTGFVGNYSPKELILPGTVLTKTVINDALAHPAKLRAESKKFLESQKIDNVF